MMWCTHGVFFSSGTTSPEQLEVLELMGHEYFTFNTSFILPNQYPSFEHLLMIIPHVKTTLLRPAFLLSYQLRVQAGIGQT
jgi:hypothetical protein